MINFDLSYNKLSGTIPHEMTKLLNCQILYLQNNQLSGDLSLVFNPQQNISNIDLSNNFLTGSLPLEAFLMPKLQVNVHVWYLRNIFIVC